MKNLATAHDATLCMVCGEGHTTPGSDLVAHTYKGQSKMLPLYFTTCDTCTSESAGLEESRANKRAVLAFRKEVDGLLTGAEIRALRKQYKLTQDQAAKLFGGGPVAFSKYENDDVAHSESMDTLLRLVGRSEATFWLLADEKGMTAELAPAVTAEKIIETKPMNTSPTVWLPEGQNLSLAQREALAVPARAKPVPAIYLELLAIHLQAEINSNPRQAQATMEMSQEHLPEPYLIALNQPRGQWAQHLIQSDTMMPLLRAIDWTKQGAIRAAEPTNLQMLLEQIP